MRVQKEKLPFTHAEYQGKGRDRALGLKTQMPVTVRIWLACSLKGGWVFKLKEQKLKTSGPKCGVPLGYGYPSSKNLGNHYCPCPNWPAAFCCTLSGCLQQRHHVGARCNSRRGYLVLLLSLHWVVESLIVPCLDLLLRQSKGGKDLGKRYWNSRKQLI